MELFSRIVASVMLLILSPIYVIIITISIILHGRPVFFKQERVGFNYQHFMLYKFRTMVINNCQNTITDATDTRITLWGKVLRVMKLDELPQVWNIVKGNMRFIGPRPELQEFVTNNDFSFLTKIKPGLTDFSSILFRNESKMLSYNGGIKKYPQLLTIKTTLGHLYTEHKSFWLDMELTFLTLLSIISPKIAISLVKKHYIKKYRPDLLPSIDKWIKY